jgi:hypothetical protein
MTMKRRDFLKLSASAGAAAIVLGSKLPFLGLKNAFAANQTLDITITDAMKQMVTHNAVNDARCYFWIYKMKADGVDIPADCPGPTIYAVNGETIKINITNTLDQTHSFFIPGPLPGDPPIFDSGPILPGQTVSNLTFTASKSGAHMYYDNLNSPVNRSMGLHGALVVRPAAALSSHNFTPYDITPANFALGANPGGTAHVQKLYDMFGGDPADPTVPWPGLKWEQGDPSTNTPPFRQYVWLYHMASPNLQLEVGQFSQANPGKDYDPKKFMDKIARDAFSPTRNNGLPQYFTVNGQSGFFSHFDPAITPMSRIGEPVVIHCMNAGVQSISHHTHCNHFFITSINGAVNPNPIWVDIYGIRPMDRIDYTFPFMRPPDTLNARGIGRPDQPLKTANNTNYWPPQQEMQTFFPPQGTKALAADGVTQVEMGQRLSPLCYPAHDHLESSQTAQGGNYNMGLITGAYIIGDRNAQGQGLGNYMDFPMDKDFTDMFRNIRGLAVNGVNATREAAGPRPPN